MNHDQTLADDDMNFVMRRLSFKEVSVNRSLQGSGTINPLPELSLVLYQDLGNFFSKLCKTLKFRQVHFRYTKGSSSGTNSYGGDFQSSSISYSQPGSQVFVLVPQGQPNMARNTIGHVTQISLEASKMLSIIGTYVKLFREKDILLRLLISLTFKQL